MYNSDYKTAIGFKRKRGDDIMSGTIDFTKGRASRAILRFFFPMLATSMLQQFYSFADTAIVGRGLGDNALAAVGNMGSL